MSQSGDEVGLLDGMVSTIEAAFAGAVKTFVSGRGVGGGADGIDGREFAVLRIVAKSVAVAALGVSVDELVLHKTAVCIEEHKVADSTCVDCPVAYDGKDHR